MGPRLPSGPPTPFGALLLRHAERAGLTASALAKAAGVSLTHTSAAIYGRRTPPPDAVLRWADTLRLQGRERTAFLRAAAAEHVPEQLRRWLA